MIPEDYTESFKESTQKPIREQGQSFQNYLLSPQLSPSILLQALPHFMTFDKKLTMIWMPTLRNRKLSP